MAKKEIEMKGVILAGGHGTRLLPLTKITNKHLLPVYDKPMILYGIDILRRSGIRDIMIVCGREHAGHFMSFLGSGKEYGVKLSYAIQDKDNAGISDALLCAEDFAEGQAVAVILGDNIFQEHFAGAVKNFKKGAMIFLKEVPDPERFGVPIFDKSGKKILAVEEKPKRPRSNFAQTGFYLFDGGVFERIKKQAPSARGEIEITDTVNQYLKKGRLSFAFVKGWWLDAGTFDSLLKAAAVIKENRGQK